MTEYNPSRTEPMAGAGAPEITQEIIYAGSLVIAEDYGVCGADIAPDLARDVFVAMLAAKNLVLVVFGAGYSPLQGYLWHRGDRDLRFSSS